MTSDSLETRPQADVSIPTSYTGTMLVAVAALLALPALVAAFNVPPWSGWRRRS